MSDASQIQLDSGEVLRFAVGGWENCETFTEVNVPTKRETVARVETADGIGAAIHLIEHEWPMGASFDLTHEMWEDDCSSLGELGSVLKRGWSDPAEEVLGEGSLLEIKEVWSNPGKLAPGRLREAVDLLSERAAPNRGLIVLKAFPTGFEGWEVANPELEPQFRSRHAALMRLYLAFGMQPFPGQSGSDGWMWRIADRAADFLAAPGDLTEEYA